MPVTPNQIAGGLTALAVVSAAISKFLQGGDLNGTEIALAISTLTAAFGFQRKK